MNRERSVIIGCDDTGVLSSVILSLQQDYPFPLNFISASREGDLIQIARSLNPELVILCFENNQNIIRNFDFYISRSDIPILCLTRSSESETLC